jgi:hypothetical protein
MHAFAIWVLGFWFLQGNSIFLFSSIRYTPVEAEGCSTEVMTVQYRGNLLQMGVSWYPKGGLAHGPRMESA